MLLPIATNALLIGHAAPHGEVGDPSLPARCARVRSMHDPDTFARVAESPQAYRCALAPTGARGGSRQQRQREPVWRALPGSDEHL